MIRILNTEPESWSPEARDILSSFATLTEENISREKLIQTIQNYEGLLIKLSHQINGEVIEKAHRLKVIASPTTGLDHIDLDSARKRGIDVLSLKDHVDFLNTVSATAEHTWALVLSLLRKLPQAFQDVLHGHWRRDLYRGMELKGKNLGIIGYGRLGRMVADYARAFGMRIYAHDPVKDPSSGDIIWLALDELFRISDVITLHLPLSEETRSLIGPRQFSFMKPRALLVNTSRGGIVNEEALLEALLQRRIAGAALDVLEGESEFRKHASSWPENDPLVHYAREHDNLVLTPHLGGATHESLEATEVYIAQQLKNYFEKR